MPKPESDLQPDLPIDERQQPMVLTSGEFQILEDGRVVVNDVALLRALRKQHDNAVPASDEARESVSS